MTRLDAPSVANPRASGREADDTDALSLDPGVNKNVHLDHLLKIIGTECSLQAVTQKLYFYAQSLAAAAVGAIHIVCADEAEHECTEAFQRGFVLHLLPKLKFANQSAFRLANLGGRYEWGAIRIAEPHFALPESRESFKLLVIKVNSHVGVAATGGGERYGVLRRYGRDSACCGVLNALLEGADAPYLDGLRDAFGAEGKDRLARLVDERRVASEHRALFAAVCAARLQARQVMIDIQDYEPLTPTVYLVLPCATLNRENRDSEIACGLYMADHRTPTGTEQYCGLGDEPEAYGFSVKNGHIMIEDEQLSEIRPARDHRQLVLNEWRRRDHELPVSTHRELRDKWDEALRHQQKSKVTLGALRMLLPFVAELAPVPAAVALFTSGALSIHHVYHAHRLARQIDGSHEARQMLREIENQIETLDPDQAQVLVEVLKSEFKLP